MRFYIIFSTCFMGIILPLIEVVRRKTHIGHIAYYIDDFIVGALLIYAAQRALKKHRNGLLLLSVAWAVLCGGLYYSFFGQVYNIAWADVSGVSNGFVVAVKGCLFAFAIVNLIISVRVAAKDMV